MTEEQMVAEYQRIQGTASDAELVGLTQVVRAAQDGTPQLIEEEGGRVLLAGWMPGELDVTAAVRFAEQQNLITPGHGSTWVAGPEANTYLFGEVLVQRYVLLRDALKRQSF